ncbi:FAD-binding protein [Pseudoduganella ginsengisoli]|uniref:FAD-binding protein n=1 Tax=Pseudoduganella ginsengisoli TaxID=1462440 RepID=A0A6L6PXH0_9BURK|nr:FAD-binding protein [Pseudoduganella ginsengisoli]MTW01648.1 FAD-binding protein [Pseudoduganella ginsengisoli]
MDQPLQLSATACHIWDDECDVLVLGFGAAGACAALAASESGARVLVLDRFNRGGASAKSGGVVYAGGGTPQQVAAGVQDTPQAMFDYLCQETGDAVSAATLRAFCEGSRDMVAWLSGHGVQFDSAMPPVKTSYPQDGYYLYYSGSEAVPAFAQHAKPAPRGHRVKGSGMSGAVLFKVLREAVARAGITVQGLTTARRLITDRAGHVIGAEVGQLSGMAGWLHRQLERFADASHNLAPGLADGARAALAALESRYAAVRHVRAHGGVVLATGGFIFNRAMLGRYAPRYLRAWRLGTTGCTGSGIALGESVGGASSHMHKVSAWRFINPPFDWARGIVVDRSGQRICNEEVYGARLGHAMCEQADGRAWLILDSRLRSAALCECRSGKLWLFQSGPAMLLMLFGAVKAANAAALAEKLGMPAAQLQQTVDAYNAAARGDAADALGKSKAMLAPLEGPLYAIDISMDSKLFPCPAITLGGLRVNENTGAVLRADGRAIGGLYAAGRTALGIASNQYVSGLSLADCVWSGRRAGTAAQLSNLKQRGDKYGQG